ncbi:MAG: glycosyltransferase 87 family protein, partial [Lachnospiraceae bacterium]|nr:glycosyltransferase 87 family protein [Lachnospiraceae bacterium]
MNAFLNKWKSMRYFKEITTLDVVFFLLLSLGSAFLYGHIFDMPLTLMQARDLISATAHGKFFDFYDIVMEKAIANDYHLQNLGIIEGANYNIVLYTLLAILILPWVLIAKLFHLGLNYQWLCQYMEVILLLADVCAAYLIKQICEAYGFSKEEAKRTAYLFLTSFLAVYATVGFNQMDIFYILVMLVAIREYANDHDIKFALCMSFAIMLKMFPLFIFIPMILLKKKQFWSILGHGALGVVFPGIFRLMFGGSAGYTETKAAMDAYYNFTNRMTDAAIPGNIYPIPIFLVGFVLLCVFA